MATATTGIWNHSAATESLARTRTAATTPESNSNSSNSASDASTISANDFLTLLVTEMQNQDPTSDQDPNEYINQLVQVNSLEQLISINQTLTGALDPTSSDSENASADVQGSASNASLAARHAALAHQAGAGQLGSVVNALQPSSSAAGNAGVQTTSGNLNVPSTNAAAMRVAHSLSGR